MTHQNLVLTEKAIKNHSKRLQKELKNYNKDLSLGETQNLFAKSLGFNNWNHLSTILNNDLIDNDIKFDDISGFENNEIIKNLIVKENWIDLNKYLNYVYKKMCEPLSFIKPSLLGDKILFTLKRIRGCGTQSQRIIASNIVELIKDIPYEKKAVIFKFEDLIPDFCALQITPKIFDNLFNECPVGIDILNIAIILACERNNTEIVQHLLINYNLNIDNFFYIGDEPIVFNPLCSAIRSNSHETIEFLLNSPKLEKNANIYIEDNNSFKMACNMGNLPLIKKLLKLNGTKNKDLISSENFVSIIFACNREHWNVVHFLLNQINYNLEPNFYKIINRDLKFFTDISKQNKLQKIILDHKQY